MEPKFQSSFIPKGPVSSLGTTEKRREVRKGGLYSYIAMVVFAISAILAVGVFAYKLYTKGTINRMSEEIAERRDTLIPETSREYIRLNNRIQSVGMLIDNHVVTSPIFDYLEASTLRNVRFTEFTYNTTAKGVELVLKGESRGYADIALQADIFSKGNQLKNPIFSDLILDEEGNVNFTLKADVDPNLISYKKQAESEVLLEKSRATTVATTTPALATSTPAVSTSTRSTSSEQATATSTPR